MYKQVQSSPYMRERKRHVGWGWEWAWELWILGFILQFTKDKGVSFLKDLLETPNNYINYAANKEFLHYEWVDLEGYGILTYKDSSNLILLNFCSIYHSFWDEMPTISRNFHQCKQFIIIVISYIKIVLYNLQKTFIYTFHLILRKVGPRGIKWLA